MGLPGKQHGRNESRRTEARDQRSSWSGATKKFFVTIKEVSDAEKRIRCDGSENGLIDNLDGSQANRCLINYDVEFSPSMGKFLGLTDTHNFQREHGKFTLYGTNHFSLFEGETGNFLVSLGACEKLNQYPEWRLSGWFAAATGNAESGQFTPDPPATIFSFSF